MNYLFVKYFTFKIIQGIGYGKLQRNKITRLGIGSLLLGVLLAATMFTEFDSQILNSNYTGAVGSIGIIFGAILILLPKLSKRQSIIGTVTSFVILLIAVGTAIGLVITDNVIDPVFPSLLYVSLIGSITFVVFGAVLLVNGLKLSEEKQDSSKPGGCCFLENTIGKNIYFGLLVSLLLLFFFSAFWGLEKHISWIGKMRLHWAFYHWHWDTYLICDTGFSRKCEPIRNLRRFLCQCSSLPK